MRKISLITGATSGIGKSLAFKIAESGSQIVILAKDKYKTEKTVNDIKYHTGNHNIDYIICDLSEQDSISRAVDLFKLKYNNLNFLINNAGVTYPALSFNSKGIEKTFAVNHLGHFFLTYLLLGLLEHSAPSKILNVASRAHIKIDFENLNGEKFYNQFKAYAYSKMANILFTFELAKRLEGTGVTVNCVHPGVVNTGIYDNIPFTAKLLIKPMSLFFISPDKSADKIITLLFSEKYNDSNGKFFNNLKESKPKKGTIGSNDCIRLWKHSNKLLNINF